MTYLWVRRGRLHERRIRALIVQNAMGRV